MKLLPPKLQTRPRPSREEADADIGSIGASKSSGTRLRSASSRERLPWWLVALVVACLLFGLWVWVELLRSFP